MRLLTVIAVVVGFVTSVISQTYTPVRYYESATGITWSSISLPGGLTYRIALPQTTTSADAIVQIISPNSFAWCGLAWGGRMTGNPLSVAWPNKQGGGQPVIWSSRMATGYSLPSAYSGASHTPLTLSPSKTNGTHWTATARCIGCTQWSGNNLNTATTAQLAYACSTKAVSSPASNTSSFQIHDTPGLWKHDFTIAKNSSYPKWIT